MSGGDLPWLLSLGVSMEEAARRCGRTVTAIAAELEERREKEQASVQG